MGSKTFFVLALGLLLGLSGSPAVSGQSLEELIGPGRSAALLAGEELLMVQSRDPRPEFLPRQDLLQRHIDTIQADLNPGIMVESLRIYRKPPGD